MVFYYPGLGKREENRKKALKGKLIINSPMENPRLYYYNKTGELSRLSTLSEKLDYILLQTEVAETAQDKSEKELLLEMVCALYNKLLEEAIDSEKYSRKEINKVRNLAESSHEVHKNYLAQLQEVAQKRVGNKTDQQLKVGIERFLASGKKLESFCVELPLTTEVEHFLLRYMRERAEYESDFKKRLNIGERFQKGDTVYTHSYHTQINRYHNIVCLYSPACGVVITNDLDFRENVLFRFIPEKGTDIEAEIGELVFDELLQYMNWFNRLDTRFRKYSDEYVKASAEKIKKIKLLKKELEAETKKIIQTYC